MTLLHDIPIDEASIATLCRAYGVKRLWLFGSVLRPDFHPDSDVDVLVELDQPIGLFRLGGLGSDLEDLLGRSVHLTSVGGVPEAKLSAVLAHASLQYMRPAGLHE